MFCLLPLPCFAFTDAQPGLSTADRSPLLSQLLLEDKLTEMLYPKPALTPFQFAMHTLIHFASFMRWIELIKSFSRSCRN